MQSAIGGRAVRPRRFRCVFALVSGLVLALSPLVSGPYGTVALLVPYLPASAHNAHGFWLAQGDLARSAHGQAWVRRAEAALFDPALVAPPFETAGSFESTDPAALGYRFSAQSGRRVEIAVELPDAGTGAEIFIDVYRLGSARAVHIASGPPQPASGTAQTRHSIELDLLDDAEYVLRLQPELGRGGRYKLGIRTAPMLGFPVAGFDTRAIQSGFGAVREGGRRSHHGVDIFVPRGTPAVAAVDARVSRVRTTPRGGNVVWLQPLFGNLRLYYAHLDTQTVEPGQYVVAGETVGTVGNTGNARTTPPHLHFGVYVRRRGGAWDPYPFLR